MKQLIQSSCVNQTSFFLNGRQLSESLPAGLSTLDYLNKHQHLYGTKCGCNEGDCGACTVVIAEPDAESDTGRILYKAINSCLYPAAKLHGRHLITIEGLGDPDNLHPIQQALLDFHGTQCGYCTPGIVMSLFALLVSEDHPDKELILQTLEGNLCRCTGYKSILEAAEFLSSRYSRYDLLPQWCIDTESELLLFQDYSYLLPASDQPQAQVQRYFIPKDTYSLFDILDADAEAKIIAGGTDIIAHLNIHRNSYPTLVDISRISELQTHELRGDKVYIGAGVTLDALYQSKLIQIQFSALHSLIGKMASRQIRNFATLGGNIANASPVGDSIPLLMVMDAILELQYKQRTRQLSIRDFFLGYRLTNKKRKEIISRIILPLQPQYAYINYLKSSKRKAVDISSVVSAVRVIHENGHIVNALMALGGVAAKPELCIAFGYSLNGEKLANLDSEAIAAAVAAEYRPLSDVRGSAEFRTQLIANHVRHYISELTRGKA